MSVNKLRLMCLVWPDDKPNDHIVQVKIDDDDTVAALKELIKDKYARRLHDVDSPDLVLWKCSISADDKLQETLNQKVGPIGRYVRGLVCERLANANATVGECLAQDLNSLSFT